MSSGKYYESHIKCDFLNYLRATKLINSRSVLASEYVLGTTGRRADLAIHNGLKFIGVEVKSQYDTLTRLPGQLRTYTACFDEAMVVLDERHIEEGLGIASSAVSVFSVNRRGEISLVRPAQSTPVGDVRTRLQLLTIQELKKLAGMPVSAQAKRNVLLKEAERLDSDMAGVAIADAFRRTFADTSEDFWRRVQRKRVTLEALSCLSRFAVARANSRDREDERARFWETWRQDASVALRQLTA